ncbi:TonB family protein [Sphingopyxis panaciterrae]|uniref:energy transducer TonB family protein n=1 Tax=Sphingopyxis panaciterrae TaxID=363841 RepID=UPI001423B29D|nr:energy transducer TonB [Sphingopyxis panaciterrae]NIJ39306.1 TonB family protein [Sphingopyxis panaciterrae]
MNDIAGIDAGGKGPAPDEGGHGAGIALSASLHLGGILLFCFAYAGNGGGGSREALSGEPMTVELLSPDSAAGPSRAGGGVPDVRDLPFTQEHSDVAVRTKGSGEAPRAGNAKFDAELASLLADDPLAGTGKSAYGAILRKHIAAHSRRRGDRIGRNDAGLVMLRFRVARDGRVVDARVLRSPNSLIGEKALAALWRSEPLPQVPAELAVPIEVDVPIDFQVQG